MYKPVKRKPRKRTTRQNDELFYSCLVWGAVITIILNIAVATILGMAAVDIAFS